MKRRTVAMARLPALRRFGGVLLLLVATQAVAAAGKLPAWLALEELGRSYGLQTDRDETGRTLRLESRWTTLEFTAGSREAAWNGLRLFLGEPVSASLGLARSDWLAVVRPLLDPAAVPPPAAPGLIVIDPGHGGGDPGAANRVLGLKEKNLTLDLARRLQRELEARGYRVALTRTTDRRLRSVQAADLAQRAATANRLGADLFVSLHFNALPGHPGVGGVETYTLTPAGQRSTAASRRTAADRAVHPGNRHDHWNAVLGAAVHSRLVAGLGATDRGLKRARFAVLRPVDCPAVLVEAGFLSNPAEARRLGTAAYRQDIAEAIGAGIGHYHERLRAAGRD
jgi:N-acetylmuramoyl-L-alanine amidase